MEPTCVASTGPVPSGSVSSRLANALVFIASGAVLVLEILAGRLLAPYVGVTLETFTGIIGVVLAGIAFGTWQGGKLADRTDPRAVVPLLLSLGGALAIASVPLIRILGKLDLGNGPVAIVLLAAVAFFLPSAVLSAVSPMVVKLRLRSVDDTGSIVGQLSAMSTFGSLMGVSLTGFVFVARFPITPVVFGVGGALVVLGIVLRLALSRGDDVITTRSDVGAATTERMAGCVVLAIAAAALTVATPGECDTDTTYYCARVEVDGERPTGRILVLDDQTHSYVDIVDPTYLGFSYAKALGDVITAMAPAGEPLDTVHIGGGGFTMPQYLEATRPGSTSLVFEVDPGVVDIARDQLGLMEGNGISVRTGDARVLLRDVPDGFSDLVIGDAFGGETVPWHLTTREFVADVQRVLRPGGVYAINLIDRPPLSFARAELATLAEQFAHVAIVSRPQRIAKVEGGNFVLVASDSPIALEGIRRAIEARGDALAVVTDDETVAFVDGQRALTDEYAPVDQLQTNP